MPKPPPIIFIVAAICSALHSITAFAKGEIGFGFGLIGAAMAWTCVWGQRQEIAELTNDNE